jgi:hypothetical protein
MPILQLLQPDQQNQILLFLKNLPKEKFSMLTVMKMTLQRKFSETWVIAK